MLKQRVITAVLMLAVLLPALFHPQPGVFAAVALVLIVGGGWEWARLNGVVEFRARVVGGLLGGALVVLWWAVGLSQPLPALWLVVGGVWVAATVWLLRRGVPGWAHIAQPLRLWLGLALIGLAWWAMAQARQQGVALLLSIFLLVWVADVAAYFGGKAFGRRKLAPNISPGKSWAGVYAGFLGVALLAVAAVWAEQHWGYQGATIYGQLWAVHPVVALLGVAFLTAMSVVGDLLESLVKRSAGVKDSSGLLPGHGGVLDRVDALLPVLPLAMLLLTLFPA